MTDPSPERRIALFVNPLAGKGRALHWQGRVQEFLASHGIAYDLIGLNYPANLIGFTDVIILGGDGTINRVLNHFPDIRLPVGVIPGGSGNDLAMQLNGSLDIQHCLETAVFGRTQWLDAGICNGRIFMNCLGVGFDGEVANEINRVRWFSGALKYYITVIRKIFRYRSIVMNALWDGGRYQARALTVMAANSQYTGGGFRVAPGADMSDGKLDMVVIGEISALQRLFYLPRIRKGNHIGLPFVQAARFTNMEIETGRPLQAHVDGELMLSSTYRIKILPGKFQCRVDRKGGHRNKVTGSTETRE
jgi:YegS/Rv2252/BmrU family lipid kinase